LIEPVKEKVMDVSVDFWTGVCAGNKGFMGEIAIEDCSVIDR
jgi:hypothetical protein